MNITKQTTSKEIEQAIMEGVENNIPLEDVWKVFKAQHPDVKYRRWRDRIYNMRKDNVIPPATNAVKLEDLLENDNLREAIESEKEKSALKQARATINKLKEALGSMYDALDDIREGFRELPQLNVPAVRTVIENKPHITLVLPLYDLHIGHITNGPLGVTNEDTYITRCTTLAEDILTEIKAIKHTKAIDRMVILFGGDIVEGRTIFQGQAKESAPLRYQLTVGPEVMARNLITPLAKALPALDVFTVPGNHGRIGDKNEFDKTDDNLDIIFSHILQLRCENIKNITWHEPTTWFNYFAVYNHTFLAVHGDGFKSFGGVPFYGAVKYKDKLQDVLNSKFDVLIAGHHHTSAEWTRGVSKICLMNNWAGTSDYSATMALGGPPSQKMILVDPSNPMLAVYEFMIARYENAVQIEPVVLT